MNQNTKPKRALIAYCVLAERLRTPGVGLAQALTPFFAAVCYEFAGQPFDAGKFSAAVADRYNIRIPRLAALGLAEQLADEGLLEVLSGYARSTVYQYCKAAVLADASAAESPVTEAQVEAVLASFVAYCRADGRMESRQDVALQEALLDRLLNADSMRLLNRREASIVAKRTPKTLGLNKPLSEVAQSPADVDELHLDFLVSQFLLDLQTSNPGAFDQVSNIAFANMAAEALACFREPPAAGTSLDGLTVYLDSPLLLDVLGVNAEYEDYGNELLAAIKASGATAALLEHCVAEAEAAIHAQLGYLRAGVNKTATNWGTSARPDILAALIGNVAARAEARLGIAVHRDPETNLHRRAATTVGDIEAEMDRRMQAWGNADAKDHDRRSVWSLLSLRDTSTAVARICDSKWLFVTRNTALVGIANDAWTTWLAGTTKLAKPHIERSSPVAMSDKQFAGYLWARSGGADGSISRARLLAHCSAAVRPRADVKARAYNLVLELHGQAQAEDLAALLEDREGARAIMRATLGDPEDVNEKRLPFILERVKREAGEYAAALVRDEAQRHLEQTRASYGEELNRIRSEAAAAQMAAASKDRDAQAALVQREQDQLRLEAHANALRVALEDQIAQDRKRQARILDEGYAAGRSRYKVCRLAATVLFGLAGGYVSLLSASSPWTAAACTVVLGMLGFWFVPDLLDLPFSALARARMRKVVLNRDPSLAMPDPHPNFKRDDWSGAMFLAASQPANSGAAPL